MVKTFSLAPTSSGGQDRLMHASLLSSVLAYNFMEGGRAEGDAPEILIQ